MKIKLSLRKCWWGNGIEVYRRPKHTMIRCLWFCIEIFETFIDDVDTSYIEREDESHRNCPFL